MPNVIEQCIQGQYALYHGDSAEVLRASLMIPSIT